MRPPGYLPSIKPSFRHSRRICSNFRSIPIQTQKIRTASHCLPNGMNSILMLTPCAFMWVPYGTAARIPTGISCEISMKKAGGSPPAFLCLFCFTAQIHLPCRPLPATAAARAETVKMIPLGCPPMQAVIHSLASHMVSARLANRVQAGLFQVTAIQDSLALTAAAQTLVVAAGIRADHALDMLVAMRSSRGISIGSGSSFRLLAIHHRRRLISRPLCSV